MRAWLVTVALAATVATLVHAVAASSDTRAVSIRTWVEQDVLDASSHAHGMPSAVLFHGGGGSKGSSGDTARVRVMTDAFTDACGVLGGTVACGVVDARSLHKVVVDGIATPFLRVYTYVCLRCLLMNASRFVPSNNNNNNNFIYFALLHTCGCIRRPAGAQTVYHTSTSPAPCHASPEISSRSYWKQHSLATMVMYRQSRRRRGGRCRCQLWMRAWD